jgi:hypothetical protein
MSEMDSAILQVIGVAGSAIAFSFGLARIILRQNEEFLRQQNVLLRELFMQLDRRLERLERVVHELRETLDVLSRRGVKK